LKGSVNSGIYFVVLPRTKRKSLVLCHNADYSLKGTTSIL
jgi:hypothetical protein